MRGMNLGLLFLAAGLVASAGPAGAKGGVFPRPDRDRKERTLYVWAGDQARQAPDFLAVIDFDEDSESYGEVVRTVPIPPPGNVGNEPHHCNLSADKQVLACGGLLSLLRGQAGIFFFDVSRPRRPEFLFATNAAASWSAITDDFLPLEDGGFLVTQMGSATGGAPGRLAEFDRNLQLVDQFPHAPPQDGFNPHGISARPDLDLLVTSDFVNPVTTLNGVPGDPELRSTVRVWELSSRTLLRTIPVPGAIGTMDVKLIPGDPAGRAITAGMFDGHVYLVDTAAGTAAEVFDCETITPHVEVPVRGGMVQLLAMHPGGNRLLFGSFQAGQVGMLDISDPAHPFQLDVVNLGVDAGPHNLVLTEDGERLVVSDYFLEQDGFGKIHFEGDHRVHVIEVGRRSLRLDRRFRLDFDTAFARPARPHGMAVK